MGLNQEMERILIVDEDPGVRSLLADQILGPFGYQVALAEDVSQAIGKALQYSPDLIMVSLTLPGLSGKDLLVALRSQGMRVPVLVTAEAGREVDAIQAFRLGAIDYLVKPLREAEVISAVERSLKEVHLSHEREKLSQQLAEKNLQLGQRVRELTTLYGIGKMVTSITDHTELFSRLMEGCMYVSEADIGWMALEDEFTEQLILRAHRNLPADQAARLHKPWKDGVSSLVMISGQGLILHGAGLQQSRLGRFCQAVLIEPIMVRGRAIGLLSVARREDRPFVERDQAMLSAVADYASISLVNARLFTELESRAQQLEEKINQQVDQPCSDQDQLVKGSVTQLADIHARLLGLHSRLENAVDKSEILDLAQQFALLINPDQNS
jgi:two-component system, NtrC family, sensor kinase